MNKLKITGIELESEDQVQSITINVSYTESSNNSGSTKEDKEEPKSPASKSPFKTVY